MLQETIRTKRRRLGEVPKMPVEEQYTAKGPAIVGFQTRPNVTSIERGVSVEGNRIGVLANGPVGVEGRGEVAGVRGVGNVNGWGGEFKSEKYNSAQLNLTPHRMDQDLGVPVSKVPNQYPDIAHIQRQLPSVGKLGDLWMSSTGRPDRPEEGGKGPQPQCHLWLCVKAGTGAGKPLWAQVLLGSPVPGRHPFTSG